MNINYEEMSRELRLAGLLEGRQGGREGKDEGIWHCCVGIGEEA